MQGVAHRGQRVVRLALIVLPDRRLRGDVVRGRGAGRPLVVDVDGEMVAAQLEDPGVGLRRLAQERDHVIRRPEVAPAAAWAPRPPRPLRRPRCAHGAGVLLAGDEAVLVRVDLGEPVAEEPGASSRLSLPSLLASDCSKIRRRGRRRDRHPAHPDRLGPRPPDLRTPAAPPRPLAKASSAARTSWYREKPSSPRATRATLRAAATCSR